MPPKGNVRAGNGGLARRGIGGRGGGGAGGGSAELKIGVGALSLAVSFRRMPRESGRHPAIHTSWEIFALH